MDLKFLNNNSVKLTLSNKDMKKYNISYDILKKNKKITKNIVLNILKNAKEFISNNIEKNKIILEDFKTKNNSNVFYINISKKIYDKNKLTEKNKIKSTIPVIAVFKKKNNMKNFCKNISQIYYNKKFKSDLYSLENNFLITIFIPEQEKTEFLALIREFGNLYGDGYVKYITIKEHCKLLFKEKAIERILTLKN